MNRTLMERARCMMSTAKLGKEFWAEAVNTTCYLINRSPTVSLNMKTPEEVWSGKPANYSFLRIFGCDAYVWVPMEKRTKVDKNSKRCIFLGYETGTKRYRLWDPTARKLIISRDVVFNEDVFQGTTKNEEARKLVIEQEASFDDIVQEENIQNDPQSESELLHEGTSSEEHEPTSFKEACESVNSDQWRGAMEEEMESLHKNKTWDLVQLPEGRKAIGCRWIYKLKKDSEGNIERYKARLVIKGYAQKLGIDFDEVFSPVVRMTTIRVVLALAASLDLELEQLDVKIAFLHGDLNEEIYMTQSEGFVEENNRSLVCRLNKSLYGLKQAPRCWYKQFDSFIVSLGFHRCEADHYAYFCDYNDGCFCILLLYVDDMIIIGNNPIYVSTLKAQLAGEFDMKDLGAMNQILGMKVFRDREDRKIWLNQKNYIERVLQRFNMQNAKPVSTPFPVHIKLSSEYSPSTEVEKAAMSRVPYLSAIGSLMFAMVGTRPNIAQAVGAVSKYMANLDFARDRDKRRSTSGNVFIMASGAVSWEPKLQPVVALSTTKAEYISISHACKEAIWLERLLAEFKMKQDTLSMHCDSQSALLLAKNPTFHSHTKHIDVCYHFVRQLVEDGKILPHKVHTSSNPADMLTKPVAPLRETLRFFPPVPYEFRTPTRSDTLPSGHCVNEKTRILVCTYAMGRMTSVWGEDCHEFKPERWITGEGKIKREPPSKFFAFMSGPRMCMGKDLAFTLMRATAASIILNYKVEVIPGQNVGPRPSVLLHMKHGVMARIKSRRV
ncbi:hypothetical protein SLEP1_g32316 [Rubroshorea leprosula]|uniref:Reverse transcriptase Ty1/copia-type domain-containing protein n=1 Tax=Rubroshorea leprosula TaxID=152421 RepID=A0AAV5KCW0_9ROSI|nr:hypothetical protein SLEP1_g32316 [Rubroshorea leprosula]